MDNGNTKFRQDYVAQPRIFSGTDSLNSPIYTQPTDSPMSLTKRTHKKQWLIVFAIAILLIIIGLIVGIIMNNTNRTNTVSDEQIYDKMLNSYDEVYNVQRIYLSARNGQYQTTGFFTEAAKENINILLETIKQFNSEVTKINPATLPSDRAKETLSDLKLALSTNMPIYEKTTALYNLFYSYINTNYEPEYANEIISMNDDAVLKALNNLNTTIEATGSWETGTIVSDIFSAYTSEETFINTDYYKLIGDLLAEVKDEN